MRAKNSNPAKKSTIHHIRGKTENKQTKRKLFFRDVVDSIQDGISVLDNDLNILFVNSAVRKLYSHKHPLIGEKCFYAYYGRTKPCEICPGIRTLKTGKQDFDTVSNGIKGWIELLTFPLQDSKSGQLLGVIEYVRDISELKRAEEALKDSEERFRALAQTANVRDITNRRQMEDELRALTLVDELTGLYNRRGFFTLAQQQLKIADRLQRGLFIIFADLDGLKSINDTFGHQEGNTALIDTAYILKETFRESDIIARIGGDEFVIMAMETTDTDPDVFNARLQEYIKSFNTERNHHYNISISIGIANYNPYYPCSLDDLIEKADTLMYEQKKNKKH